ncbi:MAG: ribosome small subunit-dependent GTPase A [Rhodoferax sp.]|nr:MAG: ribosome small subunit-dependent GTPase A [Rhodoferax sp.]
MAEADLQPGLVVAGHGRHVWVETSDGERRICHPRGKKNATVVGDEVLWKASEDEGTIEKVQPRRNLLYRQDEIRTKMFAANLDLVLILIAAEPEFSEQQLARALIAAEAEGIPALIALNKQDLGEPFSRAWDKLAPYRAMGYNVLPLALNPGNPQEASTDHVGLHALLSHMHGKKTLVLGPSGSGKSTLINCLLPDADVLTNSISTALNSGKHTTTSTTLYWLDAAHRTGVMDSPGFQEFGLAHIAPQDLASWMPDIRAHAQDCKFYNCTHLHEPGCGVISALKSDVSPHGISANRYAIYSTLHAELSQKRY